jgi:hypothetical protein
VFLLKPATAQRNWDAAINANSDTLDGMSAIGQLIVTPAELPSATLNIRVTGGSYGKGDGTVGSYAGVTAFALPASLTSCVWLTDSGVLTASPTFPTTAHIRLAQVATDASTVRSVVDTRIGLRTCGAGLGFVLKTGDTISGALSIVSSTTGNAALTVAPDNSAVGFFGVTPATQAPALIPLTDRSTGSASNTIVDVGPLYSQGTLDSNFASLAAAVNSLIVALKRHGLMSS